MSKYTTELRFICETEASYNKSQGYKKVNEILVSAAPKIFDFDFPIYDENYRLTLETKILKHYYTREISEETYGLWKLRLDAALNEIMPYYNQLYESAIMEFNPLHDVDLQRTYTKVLDGTESGTTNGKGKGSATGKSSDTTTTTRDASSTNANSGNKSMSSEQTEESTKNHSDKYSDTPQGTLTNVVAGKYLTNARVIDDTESATLNKTDSETHSDTTTVTDKDTTKNETASENSTTSETETSNASNKKIDNTETYIETVSGKQGGMDYSEMIIKFRDTLINIDMMIINALSPLFFTLY